MIVLLAGAGASAGVDASQYPTTRAFFERLPPEIRGDPLFQLAVERVGKSAPGKQVDIEDVLYVLKEFADIRDSVVDDTTPIGFLVSGNRLQRIANPGGAYDVPALIRTWDMVKQSTDVVRDRIHRLVYQYYDALPTESQLAVTWAPLLKELARRNYPVDIFTTNYDLVIDHALEYSDLRLRTGFPPRGAAKTLSVDLFRVDEPGDGCVGTYTKLHGSIAWQRHGDGRIFYGSPTFVGDHERQVIIYPGFKGTPTGDPFKAFHERFSRSLERATRLVIIGFACRDEAINRLIVDHLSKQAQVFVVDPAPRPPVHVVDELTNPTKWIESGFGRDAVQELREIL